MCRAEDEFLSIMLDELMLNLCMRACEYARV